MSNNHKSATLFLIRMSLIAIFVVGVLHWAEPVFAQSEYDRLADGFRDPPDSARPRTWWHWTAGNVTLEGITKDLEWMQRVGIAGFQLADVSAGSGQTIDEPLAFGTPEWYAAVRHAAAEAERLDLEMAIFSSPGWSETGGPWVTPEQGMKRMVWTETGVTGPASFDGMLPQAPANLDFYRDSVVLAFPAPAGEADARFANPRVSSSSGSADRAALLDGNQRTGVTVMTPGASEPAWVQLEFDEPFGARALTISGAGGGRNGVPVGRVLVGDSEDSLATLVSLPGTQLYRQGSIRTFAFPETVGRIWRIEMTGAPLDPALTMSQDPPRVVDSYQLNEFVPHGGARIHRFEEKAGSSQFLFEYETVPTPEVPAEATVPVANIVNLSAQMDADGRLRWEVPPGRWIIQRMGYVPTGARNRPATGPGSGLEADKLSGEHMEAYLHGWLDPIAEALGPLFGDSLRYMVMDSWEAGMQNWTDDMIGEFARRRGYDPTPYLPAMTGFVVGAADVSDRFLWDFRRTLADMWADYHYGTLSRLLEEQGMGIYSEAAGVSLEIPEDTLLNKKNVEIPMGEFWVRDLHPRLMYLQDVRGAASASHVYGKPLTAAESFTGGGYESPFSLKKVGDYWLAQGINRMVFHTSAHQPLDTKPGNTMVGTHINRNITWGEAAGPLMDYFSRQLYLLQQGQFVADIAYLLNEGAPSTPSIWGTGTTPTPPAGHDYDFINADVLLELASVDAAGNIVLPSGMSYQLLILPESDRMRPELLGKLLELVEGGATILGPRPIASPSLAGFPAADAEVAQLAAAIWGDLDGVSRTVRNVGAGVVASGRTPREVLELIDVGADFAYGGGRIDSEIAWLHRRGGETDIYYVANLTDQGQDLEAGFRVAGREAELWYPDTGRIEAASFLIQGERTLVPLSLAPREMVFVVFPRPASAPSRVLPELLTDTVATMSGSWQLGFPPNLGAPAEITLPALASLSEHEDDGVRFFSGAMRYSKSLDVPSEWLQPGGRTLLDLGDVADMAEVSVNGQSLGLLWKPPFVVDVTEALRAGRNELEVEVTNQWTNRIVGDRSVPPDERILSAGAGQGGFGGPPANLPASGLLGPVTVLRQRPGVVE
jgi:hypothetical protein